MDVLTPSSMLPLLGRYTTERLLARVSAMSRAASMRRSSMRPAPNCFVACRGTENEQTWEPK